MQKTMATNDSSPGDFDSERGKQVAEDHAWQNRRREILKKFGLWEEYGDPEADEADDTDE